MAFNLTANINARLANGGSVAAQLRKQLSANPIAIDVKLSGSATKASKQLTDSLKGLNAQIRAVSANSRTASSAINQLSASFTKFKSGTQELIQTANAAKKIKKETKEATDSIAEFGRVSGLALRRNTGFLLATGAVYGLGRAITSSFGEAIRFEKELVKIAQVSNRSVSSLKPLADEITRLSTTLGVASADLVDVSLILAQAGLSANETRQALDALAKTTLAATFGSIQDTTEGAIALMAQFEISAKDLGKALGATNAVSAAFAVESEDIIAAVKRAGGVFAQTSKGVTSSLGAFNEFIAVFSAVRSTTRESAESIATGLRTIFTRIQRPATIQFLKELGIQLTDVNGRFVGPFQAVEKLSKGLEGLDRRGSSFARVAEELGGFRQIGKTLALLSSSTQRIQALQVAQAGQNSINKDAEQAQQSLANAIQKTKENFTALIREIAGTKTFDVLIRTTLEFANALITLANAIRPIVPLLAAFAAVKGVNIAARFLPDFKKSLGGRGYAVGGKVSGGKGGIDDIPARLTKGEYVINRKSAALIGDKNLDNLNSIGFVTGGSVGGKKFSPTSNFIGSQVEVAPIEITLNVRDARGNVVEQRTTSAKTGSQAFDAIFPDQNESNTTAPIGRSARQGKLTQGEIKKIQKGLGIPTGPNNPNGDLLGNQNENEILALRNRQAIAAQNFRPQAANPTPRQLREKQLSAFQEANSQVSAPNNFSQEAIDKRLVDQERKDRNIRFNTRQAQLQSLERKRGIPRVRVTRERNIKTTEVDKLLNDFFDSTKEPLSALSGTGLRQEEEARFLASGQSVNNIIPSSEFKPRRRNSSTRRFINRSPVLRAFGLGRNGFGQVDPQTIDDAVAAGGTSSSSAGAVSRPRTVVGRLRNFSRRNIGKIGAVGSIAAIAALNSGQDSTLARVAGGAITGGSIGGFAGGKIGALSANPAGATFGAVIGTAIGGITGALKAFQDAKLDEGISESSKSIIESLSQVETAFAEFDSGGNTENIKKSFDKLAADSVASSRLEGQKTDLTNITTEGFGVQQRTEAAIARAQTSEQRAADLQIGNNLSSNLGSKAQEVQEIISKAGAGGASFDEVVKQLSKGQVLALAASTATDEGKVSLAQAAQTSDASLESTARSQVLGGQARVNFEEEQKRNQLLKEEAVKLAELNSQTDLFVDRMSNLSAVIDRASLAGEDFRKSNEALLSRRGGGAGIRSQQQVNVFDNPKAFTQAEITKQARIVNSFLGNNANSREAAQGVVGAKQLQTKLPSILNALSVGVRNGGESETLLPELISKSLGEVPKVLREKLQSDIRTKFFANEQASPDDVANALAAGDVADLQGSAQEVNGIFKKLVDVTNQKIGEYEQVLDTFIQLNQEANAAQDNRLQILNESANQEKALLGQRRLTVEDRSRGFNTQLGQFAGRAGSGSSVQELIARESALNSARAGSFSGAPDEVARQMANLTQSQQDSLRALELIAGNTERQNAIAEDLNSLIDSRREARQIFEDFASGSPTERRQIERNIDLANRQNNGEQFFGSRLKQASEGQRALQALVGATQGPDALKALDQKRINFLDRSGADRLFGAAGVNPGVGIGGLLNNNDALFQGQFAQLQDLNRQRGAAAAGIEGINRRDTNQFEQNGREAFNSFQTNLQTALAKGGTLDALNATLASLPETFTIGGTVNHNININGGEVLAAMDPAIRKLVTDHVNFEINRRMNPLTGETGPA